MKKLTSIFLAMVMMFALAIPALAQQNNDTGSSELEQEYEYTGEQEKMTIDLTLPGTTNIVLNPYKMEHSQTASFYVDKLADQVFSIPSTIRSKSNVALKVGMKITGAPEGVTLVDTENKATDNTVAKGAKNVYVAMQYGLTDAAGTPPTAATKMADFVVSSTATDLTDAQMVTMPIGNTTAQYLSIVFTGAANATPNEAYTSDDKVGVTIAYTFIPVISQIPQLKATAMFNLNTNKDGSATGQDITVTLPETLTWRTGGTTPPTAGTIVNVNLTYTENNTAMPGITAAVDGTKITVKKEAISAWLTAYLATLDSDKRPKAESKYVVSIPVSFGLDVGKTEGEGETPVADTVVKNYSLRLGVWAPPAQG